ncbi:hypothetical protein SD77_1692 [Bacillus badius]|uniref:Mobile element protein n=1 Tax=Bacillus badius TaxID=1455 RepID=A0ABR5AR66_BACBA|nr:hypothetical protein SD77_1692 [Bacillus badius]
MKEKNFHLLGSLLKSMYILLQADAFLRKQPFVPLRRQHELTAALF